MSVISCVKDDCPFNVKYRCLQTNVELIMIEGGSLACEGYEIYKEYEAMSNEKAKKQNSI